MSRVYTRTGDSGTTSLLYGGRASKAAELFDALGDIDEAVSALGVARSGCEDERRAELLLRLQRELFVVAADLAVNPSHRDRLKPGLSLVEPAMTEALEQLIDQLTRERPLQPVFLVPGTTPQEAAIDLGRTIVRRAERHTVQAKAAGQVSSEEVLKYLNRLSDLLFVLARQAAGGAEEPISHD